MENKELEILSFAEEGFAPLVVFETWRAALINTCDVVRARFLCRVERHPESDETFVLLKGSAVLLLGGQGAEPEQTLRTEKMQQGLLYNIRQNGWHHVVMGENSTVLVVENANTTNLYAPISGEEIARLQALTAAL